jgi:hypothetical protein
MSGSMFPIRVSPANSPMTRENPAQIGAERLVPPIQHSMVAVPLLSCAQNTPGEFGLAIIAISGTSRAPSLGTPEPTCQLGLLKTWLAPPPVAPLPSFHTSSVTYPTSPPPDE